MQEKLNKQGQNYINDLKLMVAQLWEKACEFDGIPPDSKFVIFSDENKFAKFHGQAILQLWAAQAEYAAGGYVGLKINKDGKAR